MSLSSSPTSPRICALAVFFALLAWPVLKNPAFYFEDPLYPAKDFAANDLLVMEAKQFNLLHGHYSRMGFSHPGPFYIYAFALCETLFVDLIPLLGSPLAAQAFAATFLMSLALSLYFFCWFRLGKNILTPLLATGIMMFCLNAYGAHYLTSPWPPSMLQASMIFLVTGLMGWYLLDNRWLLLALFGALQLLHAHASFIGLLPLMLLVTGGVLGFRNLRTRLQTLGAGVIVASALLALLFLFPLLLNTFINWPADWPKYMAQANKTQHIGLSDRAYLAATFLACGLGGLGLICAPDKLIAQPPTESYGAIGRISAAVFAGASASLLLFVAKAIDNIQNNYLLFWFVPAGAMLSAAGVNQLLAALPKKVRIPGAWVMVAVLAFLVSDSVPWMGYNFILGPRLERFYQDAKQLSLESRKELRISLDTSQNRNIVWSQTLTFFSKMKRDGEDFACIEPRSWHIAFTEWARCNENSPADFLPVTFVFVRSDGSGAFAGDGELKIIAH